MSFRIQGLESAPFQPLVGLSDEELRAKGVVRVVADSKPGFPDQIELRDAEPGEKLLLLNYLHQPADGPFRASHAIFVLEHSRKRFDSVDEVPSVLRSRMISLRGFDTDGMLTQAELCAGADIEQAIERLLSREGVEYLHLHYATRGCFACRVDRA